MNNRIVRDELYEEIAASGSEMVLPSRDEDPELTDQPANDDTQEPEPEPE